MCIIINAVTLRWFKQNYLAQDVGVGLSYLIPTTLVYLLAARISTCGWVSSWILLSFPIIHPQHRRSSLYFEATK